MSETVFRDDLLDVTRYAGPDLVFSNRMRYQITDITDPAAPRYITLSAEQWESLRAALGAEHPGIELRISNLSGELTRANSDNLHHAAKYSGAGDDWQELLPGVAWDADVPLPARLKIEVRPVTLGGVDVDGDGKAPEGMLM